MQKKILIIGNGINAITLAKVLSLKHKVYITSSGIDVPDCISCVNISESKIKELLEFALENEIELTIPVSSTPILSDIVSIFSNHNLKVFAPSANSSKIVSDKAFMKKMLYKLRITTPKFGIFEKQNLVLDYIKNLKNPFVLKTEEANSAAVFTSPTQAKALIDTGFIEKNKRILIEDYIYGTPFSFYTLTDGYKALPIGSSILYRHRLEGDGGQLTSGMGACIPNYKLTFNHEDYLLYDVVYPILEYIEAECGAYIGILGINGILTDDGRIFVIGCSSCLHDNDALPILSNIEDDIFSLMNSCIIGSFSDETESISISDRCWVSLTITCTNQDAKENIIYGLDNLDEDTIVNLYPTIKKNRYLEYEAVNGNVLMLTTSAPTISSAVRKLYDEVNSITFSGMVFRKDIGKCCNI